MEVEHFIGDDNIDWDNEAERQSKGAPFEFNHQFDYFIDLLPVNAVALDLGCNIGNWAPIFIGYGMKYVGFDASPTAISIARKRLQFQTFGLSRAEKLQIREWYDLVFCHTVLQHMSLETKKVVVANVHRALKPGGLFVFQEMCSVETPTTLTKEGWIKLLTGMGFEFVKSASDKPEEGLVFRRP